MGKSFGEEIEGFFSKSKKAKEDRRQDRELKRKGFVALDGGLKQPESDDANNIEGAPEEDTTEKNIVQESVVNNQEEFKIAGARDKGYSSNYYPLQESAETPPPLKTKMSDKELEQIADKLVTSTLGEDVFDRKDKYPLQEANNELMKKIGSESLKINQQLNDDYKKLMFGILSDGSKDYNTAKKKNDDLTELYKRLQDEIKTYTKLTNFDYQELYKIVPRLKDFHESANNLIKKINSEALKTSAALHEKYNKAIIEELGRFGTGTINIKDAESLNKKLEGIYNELQTEINEIGAKQES